MGLNFNSQKVLIDSAYRQFLPPLLYSLSGVIICCLPLEKGRTKFDYEKWIKNFVKAALKRVRNAARPALIICLIKKHKIPVADPESEALSKVF
jgi:hypothetical protein